MHGSDCPCREGLRDIRFVSGWMVACATVMGFLASLQQAYFALVLCGWVWTFFFGAFTASWIAMGKPTDVCKGCSDVR